MNVVIKCMAGAQIIMIQCQTPSNIWSWRSTNTENSRAVEECTLGGTLPRFTLNVRRYVVMTTAEVQSHW